jgi:hypothetical protein
MAVTGSSRMQGDVLLVGSMPFDSVEGNFRACAEALGGHVGCLPDGEVGDRWSWVGFLPVRVYSGHPDLDELSRPEGGMRQPDRDGGDFRTETPWLYRVKPDVDLRFDDLYYGRIAAESYGVFRRLRDEGVIAEDLRFQVCLPAPFSAIAAFFPDPEQWLDVYRAYTDGIGREIAHMLETIPADELVIQFDLCYEVIDLVSGEDQFLPFWPQWTFEEKLERHTAPLAELTRGIPDETVLGLHWCYGTWGGWPMIGMEDLGLCVQLSNHATRHIKRRLDYVHMPVVRHPGERFFAPLDDLDIGEARVYLGLVHHTDAVEGFRERIDLARPHLDDFGIASVCGYGRVEPEELPEILRVHRDCATTPR